MCRLKAEVMQNHEKEHVRSIVQGLVRHRKYEKLNHSDDKTYDRSSD
jgi:hypothetical protein